MRPVSTRRYRPGKPHFFRLAGAWKVRMGDYHGHGATPVEALRRMERLMAALALTAALPAGSMRQDDPQADCGGLAVFIVFALGIVLGIMLAGVVR